MRPGPGERAGERIGEKGSKTTRFLNHTRVPRIATEQFQGIRKNKWTSPNALLWALAFGFGFRFENRLKKQQQVPACSVQLM